MNSSRYSAIFLVCLLVVSFNAVFANDSDEISKAFAAKPTVTIKTVSGDCVVRVGGTDSIRVDLTYRFDFRDDGWYEPTMSEEGGELFLSEEFHGSCSGTATWTITIPEKTEIDFSTASGTLRVEGLNSRIEASTASGDVTIVNCRGDIRLNTASGDIEIDDFSGEIRANTASGDIEAQNTDGNVELRTASGNIRVDGLKGWLQVGAASGNIRASRVTVTQESSFSTASGDAVVSLSSTPDADLDLSSASGDAVLQFNGNAIKGQFEFTAQLRDGEISSPFTIDDEERFHRHGQEFVRKSFTRDSQTPKIRISTGSGEAALEK
jgi:DUF4097 and DUF4098 domain-containing protein YvlB